MPETNKKEIKRKGRAPKDDAVDLQELVFLPEGFQEKRANHPLKKQETRPGKQTARTEKAPAQKSTATTRQSKQSTAAKGRSQTKQIKSAPVKVVFLGGLNEIGKNMTAYECGNDIFIVDCGLAFPDDDMLGIDLVIPDFSYIEKNRDRVRAVLITHGHEDHIGGLPYLLKLVNVPVYATRLTLGLISHKLREHNLLDRADLRAIAPHDKIQIGCMSVEFIRVNHSIPDCVAMAITTPSGVIIQTGDFKIDFTPIQGETIDLARFGELGGKGVLALLADSTNAERPGSTMSERTVGESFLKLFDKAGSRRIIIATFASNIHRIQQVIDLAVRVGRKVAISGRSMINVTTTAMELGYLKVPEGLIVDIDCINRYPAEKLILLTTGSQGEPMSALYRMAMSDHRKVEVTANDFIIISATPIPGNEKLVSRVVNELMKQGAEVVYEAMYEVHVSGHACRDELRTMLGLTRPSYFIPVHGEYKHLKKHAQLALDMGIDSSHVIIPDIGKVLEFDGKGGCSMNATVPAGQVLVDGLGVGDVGSIVLRDRKHLAQDGLIIVVMTMNGATGTVAAGPDIVSRGFVYVREAEQLMEDSRTVVRSAVMDCEEKGIKEWGAIKTRVKDSLSTFLYQKTKRSPMILPIIMEV